MKIIIDRISSFSGWLREDRGATFLEATLVALGFFVLVIGGIELTSLHNSQKTACKFAEHANTIATEISNQTSNFDTPATRAIVRRKVLDRFTEEHYASIVNAADQGMTPLAAIMDEDTAADALTEPEYPAFGLLRKSETASVLYTGCDDDGNCSLMEYEIAEHPAKDSAIPEPDLPQAAIAAVMHEGAVLPFFDGIVTCVQYDGDSTNILGGGPGGPGGTTGTGTGTGSGGTTTTGGGTGGTDTGGGGGTTGGGGGTPTPEPTVTPTPTPEPVDEDGCTIRNYGAGGQDGHTEKSKCEELEGGGAMSWNSTACACFCLPEKKEECESGGGHWIGMIQGNYEGSCKCICEGQSQRKQDCESAGLNWIDYNPANGQGCVCTCADEPQQKADCEKEPNPGRWIDFNPTTMEGCTCEGRGSETDPIACVILDGTSLNCGVGGAGGTLCSDVGGIFNPVTEVCSCSFGVRFDGTCAPSSICFAEAPDRINCEGNWAACAAANGEFDVGTGECRCLDGVTGDGDSCNPSGPEPETAICDGVGIGGELICRGGGDCPANSVGDGNVCTCVDGDAVSGDGSFGCSSTANMVGCRPGGLPNQYICPSGFGDSGGGRVIDDNGGMVTYECTGGAIFRGGGCSI